MSSLTEVDLETISGAIDHLAKCQARGEEVVERLKSQTTTVKRWIFFEKEMSLWDFYGKGTSGWHPISFYAMRDGKITENEARCVDLRRSSYDFNMMVECGTRVLLDSSDLRSLSYILDTKLED